MERSWRERYDERRPFEGKAFHALCYAPFVSLAFQTNGNVQICCHNEEYVAGNILHNTIDQMWSGARARVLRDELKNYRFGPGCDFCYSRIIENSFENLPMRRFDIFAIDSETLAWPKLMEFAISNSCNLECIMCTGKYSSAIRAHREKRKPLPRVYSDEFLTSLRKYLPHLEMARFLGGEPFLVPEYYRIWDMMVEDNLHITCHVTTNGTQYNDRIEKLLEKIPMGFAVSIDGVTRKTVERIRVNAKYDDVMQNARRFLAYTREKKTLFGLTYCLMRQNWREFGEYCKMADEWDCPVYVNTVLYPPQYGIYTLSTEELRTILGCMEAEAPALDQVLRRNRDVWFGELERIRARCMAEPDSYADSIRAENDVKISVIIPTYNSTPALNATIRSVVAQTMPYWEIVIFDRGSSDFTVSNAQAWCDRDGRIKFAQQSNIGSVGARNAAALDARAPWLLFLDPGDCISPGYLKSMFAATKRAPRTDFVYATDNKQALKGSNEQSDRIARDELIGQLETDSPFSMHSCLVRRTTFKEFGGFDVSLEGRADRYLWQRFAQAGKIVTACELIA